jgi:hypothetical protein
MLRQAWIIVGGGLTAVTVELFRSQHVLEPKNASNVESGDFQGLTKTDQITAEAIGGLDFGHGGTLFPGDGG